MRLIDADALQVRLTRKKSEVCKQRYTDGFNDALMRFKSMVHSAPTVDAVPVIRCKDCLNSSPGGGGYVWCGNKTMPLDGFCSDGKRKESAE